MARSYVGTAGQLLRSAYRSLVVTASIALFAACSANADKSNADSALDRDLTLAGSTAQPISVPLGDTASSAAKPAYSAGEPNRESKPRPAPIPAKSAGQSPAAQNSNVPNTTPQTAPVSAPTQASSEPVVTPTAPVMKTIGSGAILSATTGSQLCSLANRPGDKIVASLTSEVIGADGARLPAGTPVLIEMAEAAPPADFAFRVRGVQVDGKLIPVDGTVAAKGETTDRRVSKGGDKGKVATGAVIGAILGRVIGGGMKGTVIGAAGGAAAGSVAAARNSTVEHCLPSGASITVTLTSPLVYPAPSQ